MEGHLVLEDLETEQPIAICRLIWVQIQTLLGNLGNVDGNRIIDNIKKLGNASQSIWCWKK